MKSRSFISGVDKQQQMLLQDNGDRKFSLPMWPSLWNYSFKINEEVTAKLTEDKDGSAKLSETILTPTPLDE